jgi:Holliday junction resolvase
MSKITFFGKSVRTESQLEKAFKDKLKGAGFLCYKFSSPAKRAVPDCIAICPNGYVVFIEFKNPLTGSKVTKLQQIEIDKMTKQGARVHVVHNGSEGELLYSMLLGVRYSRADL